MSPATERLNTMRAFRQIDTGSPQPPRCPKCGSNALVEVVKSMRRHTPAEEWFRCDKCDYLFTRPRSD